MIDIARLHCCQAIILWLYLDYDLAKDSFQKAYILKTKVIDLCFNNNDIETTCFLLKHNIEIDELFGGHTTEQLMQFVP